MDEVTISFNELAVRVTTFLSFLAAMTVIITYNIWRPFRSTQSRLVLMIAISSIVFSCGIGLGRLGNSPHPNVAAFQYFMIQWAGLAAGLWQLFLSINIVLVSFYNFSVQNLAKVEILYHVLGWGLPMIIPLAVVFGNVEIDYTLSINYPFYKESEMSLHLFYLPLWLMFAGMLLIYVIVSRRIWWTPGNHRYTLFENEESMSVTPKRTSILKSTSSIIIAYGLLLLIPTIHEFVRTELTYTLKTLALGSTGLILSIVYLQFTMESMQSVKDYFKQSYNLFVQPNRTSEYIMDEQVPLLMKAPMESLMKNQVNPGDLFQAVHDFEATRFDELTFRTGAMIIVEQSPHGGWWKGQLQGTEQVGWFPKDLVAPLQGDGNSTFVSVYGGSSSRPGTSYFDESMADIFEITKHNSSFESVKDRSSPKIDPRTDSLFSESSFNRFELSRSSSIVSFPKPIRKV